MLNHSGVAYGRLKVCIHWELHVDWRQDQDSHTLHAKVGFSYLIKDITVFRFKLEITILSTSNISNLGRVLYTPEDTSFSSTHTDQSLLASI